MSAWDDRSREPGENVQAANDALALLGVKLTPLAEMYADLHRAYTELLAEHAALIEGAGRWETIARRLAARCDINAPSYPTRTELEDDMVCYYDFVHDVAVDEALAAFRDVGGDES